MVTLNKSDWIFQIATYHRKEMELKGFNSYTDLKKLTLKEIKNLFGGMF